MSEKEKSTGTGKVQFPGVLDIFAKSRYNNVDRRRCSRVVPLKVLCLGLSRTGTSSLRQALGDLGYDDVYHQASVNIDNRMDNDMWLDAYRAKFEHTGKPFGQEEFDKLLGHCMAVTDVPCAVFWEELMDAYPDAKVILNVRDNADVWYKSFMASSIRLLNGIYGKTWLSLARSYLLPDAAGDKCAKFLLKYDDSYGSCFKDKQQGTSTGKAAYERHNNAVISKARSQGREVLVYNVKEGWGPLCGFLGHQVPDEPYPRLNDTEEYQKGTNKLLNVLAGLIVVRTTAFVLPVIVGIWAFRRWTR